MRGDGVKTLSLVAREASLGFQVDDRDWCSFSLRKNDAGFTLGAESFRVLVHRLLAFLDGRFALECSFRAAGTEWAWVASLSERHGSLYARAIGGAYVLRVHDSNGLCVDEFRIDEAEAVRWRSQLARWLEASS